MSFSESEELEALASYPEQQCLDRHCKIGRGWKIENNPYNTKWGELKTVGRLFLLEVACSPDSLLSSEVEKQFGPGSAMRCSLYNGYDLTTNEGISKIFKVIDELHPCHIWISCDSKTFSCPICDERKRVAPRRPATLEVIPQKWQVVQSDMGSWHHPQSKDKCKFILFIDEGCRFRSGKVIFENSRQMATWPLVKQVFEEHWLVYFGQPEVLRVDPEGVWRDTEASDWCATKGIQLDTIPAEAHWQIGIVENAIKQAKAVMTALAEEYHDMSLTELLAEHYGHATPRIIIWVILPFNMPWVGHRTNGANSMIAESRDILFTPKNMRMAVSRIPFRPCPLRNKPLKVSSGSQNCSRYSCWTETHEIVLSWGFGFLLEETGSWVSR